MTIRTRLTAWYSLVVVIVLVASAAVVATLRYRDALDLLDGELTRLLLTLEGVMRTEFSEGKDLASAAREASLEVVAPERTLLLVRADGDLLAVWGTQVDERWRPPAGAPAVDFIPVLHPAHPNPFNPQTSIRFRIPGEAGATRPVKLRIVDVAGRVVRELIDGPYRTGEGEVVWDGRMGRGGRAPSGAYFMQLEVGGKILTGKVTLLQ